MLTWTLFTSQFVHPVGGEGRGYKRWILASYKFYFIRVHDNMDYDPSNNKSIVRSMNLKRMFPYNQNVNDRQTNVTSKL